MKSSLFDSRQIQFLRPRPLLQELMTLLEIQGVESFPVREEGETSLSAGFLSKAFLDRLVEEGSLQREDRGAYDSEFRITAKGRERVRYLMVDFFQELLHLHGYSKQLFRRRFLELYSQGARRVAFYPASETAEVAFSALEGSGLTLVAVADDDENKWGSLFHGLEICPLPEIQPDQLDTLLVTTCTYQNQILPKLKPLEAAGIRVALFP
ncbi:MAG: hypothetical protein HY399_01280 [Elusimicrobia bacterium]|nr:hypothetical protein [Elusimicrobiota bacterium]